METANEVNIAILKMQMQKNISYDSTDVEHLSWPTRHGNSKDDFNTNTHTNRSTQTLTLSIAVIKICTVKC